MATTASASVTRRPGNQNELTITVTEHFEDGSILTTTETFVIHNNSAGTFVVGHHLVFVDTKGNTQIRAIFIVG